MFSCRDATNLMTDEREAKLAGGVRWKYRLHMLVCGPCKAYRRQLEQTIAIVGELPRAEIPREKEDDLVAAFRARAVTSRSEDPKR